MSSTYGAYQDSLLGHTATSVTHHTTNHTKLEELKTLQSTNNSSTNSIDNKVVLPSALSSAGNLKVSIEEGSSGGGDASASNQVAGNSTLTSISNKVVLPSALSTGSNLKVSIEENAFDGAVTNAGLTDLASAINSSMVDVNVANGGFDGAVTNAGLTELASAINSSMLDVNVASGGFNGAVTNAGLTDLASAINSSKVDVNLLDIAKGQNTMMNSLPVAIASNQSALENKETRAFSSVTTLASSLSVIDNANTETSVVTNDSSKNSFVLDVSCADATYIDFEVDLMESIDNSSFHTTQSNMDMNYPKLHEFLKQVTPASPYWKLNVRNTGASTKTFTIKYISS